MNTPEWKEPVTWLDRARQLAWLGVVGWIVATMLWPWDMVFAMMIMAGVVAAIIGLLCRRPKFPRDR